MFSRGQMWCGRFPICSSRCTCSRRCLPSMVSGTEKDMIYFIHTGVFWPFPSNKLYERQKRTCFNDITYHDIKGSIKQTAGQTADYKCQQTIQPSSWPSFKATPKAQTVMTRLALHLFAPSIGSSFDIFLSDSFTKSPLHSQVTWSSSVWKRGGKQLVKLSRTRTTKKRVTGCVKDWKCSSRIRGWISWGTYLWLGVCMNVSFQDQGVGIRLEQQGLLVHPASWQN